MKVDFLVCLIVTILVVMLSPVQCLSYEKGTHQLMSRYIVEKTDNPVAGFLFDSYLQEQIGLYNGFNQIIALKSFIFPEWFGFSYSKQVSARDCIETGSMDEDAPVNRCAYHFHDPLKNWSEAGLKGIFDSSVIWAQKERNGQYLGEYSWHDVRDYFYAALTATDGDVRAQNLVMVFEGIGHLMHLVQDASVPAHSRDDGHVLPIIDTFETFVLDNFDETWLSDESRYTFNDALFALTPMNSLASIPIAKLVDADEYNGANPSDTCDPSNPRASIIGLAEYTNANFFSEDTIFQSGTYPYPGKTSVDKAQFVEDNPRSVLLQVTREYMTKISDGDTNYKLCTVPIMDDYVYDEYGNKYAWSGFDEDVYKQYAERLIPRAVSYSAGLLKYFFRGTLEILLPSDGVYAFRPDAPNDPRYEGFNKISLLVKNTTTTGEQMLGGTLELVVQYRVMTYNPDVTDPKGSAVNPFIQYDYANFPTLSDPMYIKKSVNITTNPAVPTLIEFDLGTDQLPLWAVDVSFTLVYKGKLGYGEGQPGEDNAICVGYKNVAEPTAFDIDNSTDVTCIDNNWYNLLDPDDLEEASTEAPFCDYEPNDLVNLYILFSPFDRVRNASPTQYKYMIPSIAPGWYARIYFLTDSIFTVSLYSNSFANPTFTATTYGVKNYTVPLSTGALSWLVPYVGKYRGVQTTNIMNFEDLMCDVICHAGEGEETYEGWLSHCPTCYNENCPFNLQLMQ